MAYKTTYLNLFKTIPDLQKSVKNIQHYINNCNIAKTGIYFLHNFDMFLYNISQFKGILRKSTKKAEDIEYYPFQQLNVLPKFVYKDFNDIVSFDITTSIHQYEPHKLVEKLNLCIEKLNSERMKKEEIVKTLNQIGILCGVMHMCYKTYVKEYEKNTNKGN